jgi:hypothetical protein
MTKFEILEILKNGLKENIINADDLNSVVRLSNLSHSGDSHPQIKKPLNFGKIFSLIGGLIIFLGLSSLVGQYWREMNSFLRIGSTLGIGLLLFSVASYIMLKTKQRFTGLALHLIPPILIAFGANILLFEVILGQNSSLANNILGNAIIYFFIFGLYSAADYFLSSKLFSFVSWITGTVTYWSIVFFFIQTLNISTYILYENKVFVVFGLIYSLVTLYALYLNNYNTSKKTFNDIILFMTAGYTLANIFWFLSDKLILESLFSLVLFYSTYISIRINKLAILVSSILGIIIYLTYLSSRYFSNTLGWPVSLIIIGLTFVGSGFLFINLKKKLH